MSGHALVSALLRGLRLYIKRLLGGGVVAMHWVAEAGQGGGWKTRILRLLHVGYSRMNNLLSLRGDLFWT